MIFPKETISPFSKMVSPDLGKTSVLDVTLFLPKKCGRQWFQSDKR